MIHTTMDLLIRAWPQQITFHGNEMSTSSLADVLADSVNSLDLGHRSVSDEELDCEYTQITNNLLADDNAEDLGVSDPRFSAIACSFQPGKSNRHQRQR